MRDEGKAESELRAEEEYFDLQVKNRMADLQPAALIFKIVRLETPLGCRLEWLAWVVQARGILALKATSLF